MLPPLSNLTPKPGDYVEIVGENEKRADEGLQLRLWRVVSTDPTGYWVRITSDEFDGSRVLPITDLILRDDIVFRVGDRVRVDLSFFNIYDPSHANRYKTTTIEQIWYDGYILDRKSYFGKVVKFQYRWSGMDYPLTRAAEVCQT